MIFSDHGLSAMQRRKRTHYPLAFKVPIRVHRRRCERLGPSPLFLLVAKHLILTPGSLRCSLPVRSGCLEQPLQADLSAQTVASIWLFRSIGVGKLCGHPASASQMR